MRIIIAKRGSGHRIRARESRHPSGRHEKSELTTHLKGHFVAGKTCASSQTDAASLPLKYSMSCMAAFLSGALVETHAVISTGVAASGGNAPTTWSPAGGLR